jgi:2-keto-4-pentenoate hydratase/2-oxohepta-3-ene-1,7-dioic acid hydratase in catechol pathway
MKPPRLLQAGDRVRVEIEGLGALDNTVVAEPDPALL